MGTSQFSVRNHFIILLLVMLIGSIVVYITVDFLDKNEKERKQTRLEEVNRRAAFEFSESLDRFVFIIAGLRSHLKYAHEFPNQTQLFDFINDQLNDLDYSDSLIVSYLNPQHEFVYSFDRNAINPSGLIGISVKDLRDEETIKRLDAIMDDEEFHLYPATNLVEGWVGIPLHFNVVRDEKSIGYIAAIINFKAIIDPIYELESSDIFAFRFSANEIEFDRERSYDGSRVHHERVDSKYFRNYELPEDEYVYSSISRHGLTFNLGTAYIAESEESLNLDLFLYGWLVVIAIFVFYSLFRLYQINILNKELQDSLETIEFQKTKLDIQNEELNKLNFTKDRFFSIIGHDLKGPLASISSMADLWSSKSLSDEKAADLMEKLSVASRSATRLLENLLQWALVNTGEIKWKPEKVNLGELVSEVFFQLSASASEKQIQLDQEISDGCVLMGDRNMLTTSIRNLVANAIKFTKVNTTIHVKSYLKDGALLLEVQDEGDGFTEDERVGLFALGDRSPENKNEISTGLGLILVKEFVTRHKGKIQVESDKGKGTRFIIEFPIE